MYQACLRFSAREGTARLPSLLEDFKRKDKERATKVAVRLEDFRKPQVEAVAARGELIATMKTAKEVTNGYRSN